MPSLSRFARPQREPRAPLPRPPHPSWDREASLVRERAVAVSAREFWQRLGL